MTGNSLKGKKVLITGASGFIGSHMVQRLAAENANVSIIARQSSDLWRIEQLLKYLDVFRIDLRDVDTVKNCVGDIKPDYIFHMGAYGVDARQNDYDNAINTNITGTVNILRAAAKTGCRKFINTGTCAEYGNKNEIISEEATLRPLSIYGSTKAASVIIAHQIANEYALDIITLRSFGVFGENEGSHKFFPYIILSILNNQEVNLTLCGQYRDYCYIENIIDGFVLAALNQQEKNAIYNIGSGTIFNLKHYVNLVYSYMNTEKRPNFGVIPYRENEMWKQQADITKIKKELSWKPEVTLEDGIFRTINWFRNNQDKYDRTGR